MKSKRILSILLALVLVSSLLLSAPVFAGNWRHIIYYNWSRDYSQVTAEARKVIFDGGYITRDDSGDCFETVSAVPTVGADGSITYTATFSEYPFDMMGTQTRTICNPENVVMSWDFETDPEAQGWTFGGTGEYDRNSGFQWKYPDNDADAFMGRSGRGYLRGENYVRSTDYHLNDKERVWAYSPAITLPNKPVLSFMATGGLLSSTNLIVYCGESKEDMTKCKTLNLCFAWTGESHYADYYDTPNPMQYTVDLSEFRGKTVYLKFAVRDEIDNIVYIDEVEIHGDPIATPPAITTQPANKTVAEGGKATFKVVASGTDPLTYQWQYSKNGTTWTDKAGATSASYTVTAKASYNGLYYRCKVSNAGGEVFSNKVKLTVTSTPKPVITTQPANKTVAAGASATFQVAASGTGLTYQWQYSKNGTTWTNKTGATSASYTVTAKESYNGMLYRCIVTNAGGSVTSGTAKLTVTVAKPVITTQPKAATAAVGATATYKVVASGTGLTYQWQYSNDYGATWHNKSGATSASYTVTAKAAYNGMLYRCRVKNSGGTVYSSKVRLTVSGVKPKVLSQPKAATAAAGGSVTFKVVAAGESMSYQWQYSTNGGTTWKNKTGATSASYTVTAKASYNGILYRCRVKNSYGTVYSESAKLTVS